MRKFRRGDHDDVDIPSRDQLMAVSVRRRLPGRGRVARRLLVDVGRRHEAHPVAQPV
jgi:hypothetical protein